MKILGRFRCLQCGSVQNGISEPDALAQVEMLNRHLADLPQQEREQWYGSGLISIARYRCCFYCGSSSEQFEPVTDRRVQAVTNQLIVAPGLSKKG